MRILMLIQPQGLRGAVPTINALLETELSALGCSVRVAPWGRRSEDEGVFEKVTDRFRDVFRTRASLKRGRFDVLVIHTAHDWRTLVRDIALALACCRSDAPLVLHFHGSSSRSLHDGPRLFRLANGLLVRLVDAAIVLSSEERRDWETFYPNGRFYVVENPFIHKPDNEVPLRCESDTPTQLLFVGRLVREKGLLELLQAFSQVAAEIPCRLSIAGDGPLAVQLREQVHARGLEDLVTLCGWLEGKQLEDAYAAADALVLPSWSEGFPNVVLEAMNAALPVVTTQIDGLADHLTEGVNALFVPVRDPDALASAITCICTNPELRREMSRANRKRVKEFAPESVAPRYLNILNDIVATAS